MRNKERNRIYQREWRRNKRQNDPAFLERDKAASNRAYRKRLGANEAVVQQATRRYIYKTRYGITIEIYDEILRAQNGVCAICLQPEKHRARLAVDHSHKTGEVRGLLCVKCNSMIGMSDDDCDVLDAASHYLRERR